MARKSISRAAKVLSTTERTACASGKSLKLLKCFYTKEGGLPIGTLPVPMACPFCQSICIAIVFKEVDSANDRLPYIEAHAECDDCGCKAGETTSNDDDVQRRRDRSGGESWAYYTVVEVASRWNRRSATKRVAP